jgi:hypothetical protein
MPTPENLLKIPRKPHNYLKQINKQKSYDFSGALAACRKKEKVAKNDHLLHPIG